ncbi:MAG: hypothetical protein OEM59_06470 [Rhodospirillales bacterium]|nr:hypothetical protein [Rhodospirillales bacterium]
MISETDVYRSAGVLIGNHGGNAPDHAAQFADEFLEAGDMDGYLTWREVLRAIDEVLRPAPWPGEQVH